MQWNNDEISEKREEQTIVDLVQQELSTEELKNKAEEWCCTMPDNNPNE